MAKPISNLVKQQILEGLARGKTQSSLARKFNVSRKWVNTLAKGIKEDPVNSEETLRYEIQRIRELSDSIQRQLVSSPGNTKLIAEYTRCSSVIGQLTKQLASLTTPVNSEFTPVEPLPLLPMIDLETGEDLPGSFGDLCKGMTSEESSRFHEAIRRYRMDLQVRLGKPDPLIG